MIRIRSLVVVSLVAADACRTEPFVHAARVTLLTGYGRVCSREGECCHRRVIEGGPCPRGRRVAGLAGRRESCRRVIRVVRVIEIRLVTTDASRREPFIDAAGMALLTICIRMRPGQRERSC